MAYQYKFDDNIYDIESKPDAFTDAQLYPKQNKLIISLIQDKPFLRLNNDETFNQDDQQVIINRIKKVNPALKDTKIVIENLKRVPSYDEWNELLKYQAMVATAIRNGQDWQKIEKPNHADESLIGFAQRMGIANSDANGNHMRRPWGEAEHNAHNNFLTKDNKFYSNDVIKNAEDTSTGIAETQNQTFDTAKDYNDNIMQHAEEWEGNDYPNVPDSQSHTKVIHTSKTMAQYYPLKKTDTLYNIFKDTPDPRLPNGLHLGYNSTNYDLTMLASILSCIEPTILNSVYDKRLEPTAQFLKHYSGSLPGKTDGNIIENVQGMIPSANYIRTQMNDPLFQQHINDMWNFIPFGTPADYIKKGWLSTNRYLDVSKFNEHQRKVSLKRISGMMGLQIKESDKLGDDNNTVDTLDNLAELLAYNVSDVYNTKLLFEDPAYQDGFQLKQSLLETYPYVVYQQSQTDDNIQNIEGEGKDKIINYGRKPVIDPMWIRTDRLHTDDSSAKFIANVISPFEKLEDIPAIDLTYPAKVVLDELRKQHKDDPDALAALPEKPYDVLDDTHDWVYGEGRYKDEGPHLQENGKKEFEKIYQFYKAFRGTNTNEDMSIHKGNFRSKQRAESAIAFWLSEHPDYQDKYLDKNGDINIPDVDIHEVMKDHDTNVFYMDGNDQKTSSIANLSIGGIHGAEIKLSEYNEELKNQAAWNHVLDTIKTDPEYNSLEDAYLNHKDVEFQLPFEDKPTKMRKFFMSKSTGKKAYLKPYKMKDLFKADPNTKIEKVRKEYTYVSVGQASHEDFSSYYPTLLTMLAVFRDPDDGSDVYADVYHERLALKDKLRHLKFGTPEYDQIDLEQKLRKLLLNSASGAGDATFESNIKMNNATISMRIIGQLFAWRIGQAEANAGARVPSTNTDGLYVMDIDPKINDKILFHTVKPMLITIEPEVVDRFVSKDANNRVEVNGDKIAEAKGGTLTSWRGPSPMNNLSHPAICDAVLAEYLAFKPSGHNPTSPCDQEFDRAYATKIFKNILARGGSYHANMESKLKLLQWVLASGITKHRHNFFAQYKVRNDNEYNDSEHDTLVIQHLSNTDDDTATMYGEGSNDSDCVGLQIPRTNRVFMVQRPANGQTYNTVQIVTKHKVAKSTLNKRRKEWSKTHPDQNPDNYNLYDALTDPEYEKPNEVTMMKQYVNDETLHDFHEMGEAVVCSKVTDMPNRQPVITHNQALSYFTKDEYYQLLGDLDIDAYMDIIESKFNKSWKN